MVGSGNFPGGHRFAFTILDDTDDTTLANGQPIYQFLKDCGFRTTKTVWALDSPPELQGDYFAAETLQSSAYLAWVHELAKDGFEIAFHNASMGTAVREETLAALDFIEREFPGMPRLHCNHGQNRENLYWGSSRYSSAELALGYRVAGRLVGGFPFEGHLRGSPYYWGDIAAARIAYIRRYALARLDCGRIFPGRPYTDGATPAVRCWFNTADAPDAAAFTRLVTKDRVDALASAGSWCVVSTHLGKGFVRKGRVDESVQSILRYVASLNGWFVPVSDLLDHLVASRGCERLSPGQIRRMEYAHVLDRVWGRVIGRP